MSDGMNIVILVGNLGQDPELRYTQSQKAVLSLRLATSSSWYDETQQERVERTEWHTVVVWGPRAEGLAKVLSKGGRIGVEGELRTRKWADKDNVDHYTTEVHAQEIKLLGGGKRASDSQP